MWASVSNQKILAKGYQILFLDRKIIMTNGNEYKSFLVKEGFPRATTSLQTDKHGSLVTISVNYFWHGFSFSLNFQSFSIYLII